LVEVARKMRTFIYDPARSFRAWLKTLAHGAWCDWLDRQRRQAHGSGDTHVLHLLQTAVARDDLVQRLEQKYDAELLEVAQARVRLRIGPRSWDAFRLLALERWSGAEAAAELGMRVGAVYVARSRVQKLLQEEVRRLEEGG
jgi:RNA polymerase sigma-70 factor (ECF subfamily)